MGRTSTYPPEFRKEAVELVLDSGRSIGEVARSLGLYKGTLSNWVSAARQARAHQDDPGTLNESERDELKRLRREVAELRSDKEILRRAAAYFARETTR